jgi:major membrane immunogen (membrane-anchored lipoprotein)
MKRFWLLMMLSALFISCSQELTPKGNLVITSTGLPAGETVQVTVTGPNGFSDEIVLSGTDSFTLDDVLPGTYTVTTETIDGFRDVAPLTTTVTNTSSKEVTLAFAEKNGSLKVNVAGKVGATPAVVTVRGPLPATTEQSLSFTANGAQTLSALKPGNYEIVAGAVALHSTPANQTVEVKDAQEASSTLTYVALANLNITVSGIGQTPLNAGSFTLTGPNSFSQTTTNANATFNFVDLQPGAYTLTIVNPTNHDLIGAPSPRTLNLTGAQTATETIIFEEIQP